MATSYFPFDAGAGSAISESQWQKMARRWLKSGVLTGYLNALAVTADGSGMTVSVNTGGAWVEGFYFENDAAAAQTIAAAHATLSRIDRIAVRLDRTANTCALVVLTGTAAASPVAPTLSTTDTLYEIGLATVLVDPAVGVIASGKVTDTRTLVKNLTEADASAAYEAKVDRTGATTGEVPTLQGDGTLAFAAASTAFCGVRATKTAAQSIPNATWTGVTFPTEAFDSDAFHDLVTNNGRLTVPTGKGGYYQLSALIDFAGSVGGSTRGVRMKKNGTVLVLAFVPPGANDTTITIPYLLNLAATDYVELEVYQDSGGALNLPASATAEQFFGMYRVAP